MKIYIDINHPAHVHYFKNFIKIMESKGYSFVISNRDSKIINDLLDKFEIKHSIRNKRPTRKSLFHTILYLLGIIWFIVKQSLKTRPDLYMGFASSPCAISAFLFRKPSILFDDTEHNKVNHSLYKPFCSAVLTPFYFKKKLGKNQQYFQGYIEQLYLHSKYYRPNPDVLKEIGLEDSTYALVRYIAYDARHDSEVKPLAEELKKQMVLELSRKMRVLVSSESETIDPFYKPYLVKFSAEKMHDVIAHASFFLTEGATMASEACMLGVPYLYINPLQNLGYIMEQLKSYPEMASACADGEKVMGLLMDRLNHLPDKDTKESIKQAIEHSTINPTSYLVCFVEDFMKKNKK